MYSLSWATEGKRKQAELAAGPNVEASPGLMRMSVTAPHPSSGAGSPPGDGATVSPVQADEYTNASAENRRSRMKGVDESPPPSPETVTAVPGVQ